MNKIELTKDMDNHKTSFPSTPEQEVDTKKLFGFSTKMKIFGFKEKTKFVPEIDEAYVFDENY